MHSQKATPLCPIHAISGITMYPPTLVSDIFAGAFGKKQRLNAGMNPSICTNMRSRALSKRTWRVLNKQEIAT
jgi:hypothetical protein